MCGIVGAWGTASPGAVARATSLMRHRGPDDTGQYASAQESLALGHVRLSIQDVTACGHQPMRTDDGAVVLVYNGEIYNVPALRAGLVAEGVAFHGHSDTEVLLALYMRDGVRMLPQLNGIFAFAVWDARRGELLLARDPLGVKPLYFSASAAGFAFASEIKALLPLVDDVGELDAPSIHRYLTFLWNPGEGTPVKGVRKLGPGEAMVVRAGRIARRWRWYALPAARPARAPIAARDAVAATEAALRTAVHRQLLADVPVGAFLSGGLDSSAIVAMAREATPGIQCFTIDSDVDAGTTPDLPYARRVARHLGVPLEVVRIDSATMAADLEQMIHQLDEPLADPAALNVLYISRLARSRGIKVLLSGAGGDDLFTGYRRHVAMGAERLWAWLPLGIRAAMHRGASRLDQRNPHFRRAAKLLDGAALDGNARLANYFVWADEERLRGLYTPEFRRAVGAAPAVQPMLDFLGELHPSSSRLGRFLAVEQRFFLADHNLTYTDKMGMAAGVEIRVPFLDLELVELAARLPDSVKQRGREGKWVLKRAMERYLPRDVIYRPKSGFGAPLRRWMRHELRELVGERLSDASLRDRGLFDPAAVRRLIAQNDSGEVDASYTVFSLLAIEIWCRRFLDGRPGPAPMALYPRTTPDRETDRRC